MTRASAKAKRATRAEVERMALTMYLAFWGILRDAETWDWMESPEDRAGWRKVARRAIALGAKLPAPKRRSKP